MKRFRHARNSSLVVSLPLNKWVPQSLRGKPNLSQVRGNGAGGGLHQPRHPSLPKSIAALHPTYIRERFTYSRDRGYRRASRLAPRRWTIDCFMLNVGRPVSGFTTAWLMSRSISLKRLPPGVGLKANRFSAQRARMVTISSLIAALLNPPPALPQRSDHRARRLDCWCRRRLDCQIRDREKCGGRNYYPEKHRKVDCKSAH